MRNPICRNCTNYDAYYTMFVHDFIKSNRGYCKKKKEIMKFDQTCDMYLCSERKIKMRTDRLLDCMEKTFTNIAEMSQVLKERGKELDEFTK